MLIPQSGQAKFWLKFSISPSVTSTIIRPLPRLMAVSIESVRRFSMPERTIRRSTTISMLCLIFLSRWISSESSYWFPSIRTRTNPLFLAWSNTFTCSPFRPRTTGARSWIFDLPGSSMIWSTIWSIVCFLISLPHLGQCGIPIRAYKRRI